MATTVQVALVGFNVFERNTLEAFFRLSSRRSPSYAASSDVRGADVLIVDGDQPASLAKASHAPGKCLLVGARDLSGQLARVPRPINMMSLLKTLDAVVPFLTPAGGMTEPMAAAAAPAVTDVPDALLASPPKLPPLMTMPPLSMAAPPTTPRPTPPAKVPPLSSAPPPAPAQASAAEGSSGGSTGMDHILVVDDSDIALRFMASCLGRFGFEVHLARSGEEALQRVAQQAFEFVFMDVTMPGIDGYQTCKLIRNRPYPAGRRPPSVVMLTSRGGMVDKMRGTMAGCDAYLTKPLQQEALLKVIGDRIVETAQDDTTARVAL